MVCVDSTRAAARAAYAEPAGTATLRPLHMPTQHANIRNHQASPADPPRRILYAFLIATAFIVYASLYPFSFHPGSLIDAIHTLLRDHNMHDQPWSGLIANIAFYWPLGFFCTAAQSRARPAWRRVCWA